MEAQQLTVETPGKHGMNQFSDLIPTTFAPEILFLLPGHFPGALPASAEKTLDVGGLAGPAEGCGWGRLAPWRSPCLGSRAFLCRWPRARSPRDGAGLNGAAYAGGRHLLPSHGDGERRPTVSQGGGAHIPPWETLRLTERVQALGRHWRRGPPRL